MATRYRIVKLFVNGLLKGLTYTEVTTAKFVVGKTYKSYCSSGYQIVSVEVLTN